MCEGEKARSAETIIEAVTRTGIDCALLVIGHQVRIHVGAAGLSMVSEANQHLGVKIKYVSKTDF